MKRVSKLRRILLASYAVLAHPTGDLVLDGSVAQCPGEDHQRATGNQTQLANQGIGVWPRTDQCGTNNRNGYCWGMEAELEGYGT